MKLNEYLKIPFALIISLILISCNKDDAPKEKTDTQNNQSQDENGNENDSDSTMSPEEAFSSALVQDILGENDDPDLQIYLEEQIFPLVSKSNKVTIDRVSSSQYLLSYDEAGALKNLVIQKYYSPGKDEFVFEKKESVPNLK